MYYRAIEEEDADLLEAVSRQKDLNTQDEVSDEPPLESDVDIEYRVTGKTEKSFDGYEEGYLVSVKLTGSTTCKGDTRDIDRTSKLPVVHEDAAWKGMLHRRYGRGR